MGPKYNKTRSRACAREPNIPTLAVVVIPSDRRTFGWFLLPERCDATTWHLDFRQILGVPSTVESASASYPKNIGADSKIQPPIQFYPEGSERPYCHGPIPSAECRGSFRKNIVWVAFRALHGPFRQTGEVEDMHSSFRPGECKRFADENAMPKSFSLGALS